MKISYPNVCYARSHFDCFSCQSNTSSYCNAKTFVSTQLAKQRGVSSCQVVPMTTSQRELRSLWWRVGEHSRFFGELQQKKAVRLRGTFRNRWVVRRWWSQDARWLMTRNQVMTITWLTSSKDVQSRCGHFEKKYCAQELEVSRVFGKAQNWRCFDIWKRLFWLKCLENVIYLSYLQR